MRPALLAVSATTLLAIGTSLALQAIRPPATDLRTTPAAIAAAPSAVRTEVEARAVQAAAGPASEPRAAAVVKVKTVRIDPQLPPPAPPVEPTAAPAADIRQPEAAALPGAQADEPATSRLRTRATPPAAHAAAAPEEQSIKASPRPRMRTAHAKLPEITGKRASRAKRTADQLAGDDVAKDSLSYAPKEAGPESLNPLGRLLTGTR
jgi:hypothetical protein